MTTPPQPQNQTIHTSNHHNTNGGGSANAPTASGRSRKRPAPGTSAPIISPIPAVTTTSPSPPPSLSGPDMSYLGIPQTSSPRLQQSSLPPGQNIYPTVPHIVEAYRSQQQVPISSQQQQQIDANSQIALINRGTNTLIRMPYNTGPTGIPQMGASAAAQMGMMGVSGLGQVIGPPGQVGPDGMDLAFDRELQMRIDKMRKKRATIPPFVQKLSSFVNDPKTDALIRWSPSGNSFLVLDEDEFSKTLIPDLFKHNNYASFVRQLNMYGFHKVVGLADGSLKTSEQRSKPPSEYENPYFKRGQPDLMWLISKPKGKGKRKQPKKNHQEDSDNAEDLSDGDGEFGDGNGGRGYIEGPKVEGQDGGGHHQQSNGGGRNTRPDIAAVIQQLEAVRNHQAMISAAINRLRKDHNQLYEQSVAFQTLHDRHENSINAILSFLATVYDKSLGGNINGPFSTLFQNQVEHLQPLHQQGVGAVVGNSGGAIVTPRQGQRANPNQMARRRQLLLENGPQIQISEEESPKPQNSPIISKPNGGAQMKANMGSPVIQNYQTYQSPSIQELNGQDTPTLRGGGNADQYQNHQTQYPNIFSLPDSPIGHQAASSPVSAHSMTPRLFPRPLAQPGLSAQTLQDHNAQLAAKAREIEELEELQTAQTHHVDELMDMMTKFADTDAATNGGAGHMNGNGGVDSGGSNIDEFLNWGLNGDGSMANGFTVDGDGQSGLEGVDDLNALFSFGANGPENADALNVLSGNRDNSGLGVGKVLGTNPSTVVASPAGSTASRAREEIDEEVEEVAPKRRRMG
ncbi:hypothetical protein DFP73DRAFT_555091 [Morchella snyderi]|nr:hypothetical protein DFP73DRAFT_555091 [Morchella snyderi]